MSAKTIKIMSILGKHDLSIYIELVDQGSSIIVFFHETLLGYFNIFGLKSNREEKIVIC